MRALAFAVLLMGCATAQSVPPPARVAGCWADRTQFSSSTMRWRAAADGALRGELREAPSNGEPTNRAFVLRAQGEAWEVCDAAPDGACWAVAQEANGSLEGGRAFIDRYRDRLHFSIVDNAGRNLVRFVGESAPCS